MVKVAVILIDLIVSLLRSVVIFLVFLSFFSCCSTGMTIKQTFGVLIIITRQYYLILIIIILLKYILLFYLL